MRDPPDLLAALGPVLRLLETLEVPYMIGGSVASSLHGMPRATMDVDLVADLDRAHIDPLLAGLGDDYYASRSMITDAMRDGRAFNLIHQGTMLKVDVFPVGDRPYDRVALERRERMYLVEEPDPLAGWVATAEDVVLRKLEWSRRGDSISEVQWRDVLGILETHGPALDGEYLRRWAEEIGVRGLLDRAGEEAGSS